MCFPLRHQLRQTSVGLLVITIFVGPATFCPAGGPYQATGLKVGEVTDTSAIVWTRLTLRRQGNPSDGLMVSFRYSDGESPGSANKSKKRKIVAIAYPPGVTVADIRNAVPGVEGEVRVRYRPAGGTPGRETDWRAVQPEHDYTRQFRLTNLKPNTRYEIRAESRGVDGSPGQALDAGFLTAPRPDQPVRVVFTVSTGQGYGSRDRADGYNIYPEMLKLKPGFFVHTGDIVYYDKLAKDVDLARYHWQRTYSLPTNVAFHRGVASYFIKDDHDTWQNDCWPGMKRSNMFHFTFAQGQAVFREQVPMGKRTYRSYRWGKDLQIWLVEGRDFRSPNEMPDGPNKTIWGSQQKAWFKATVRQSDATFRVLISPTPLVGPDRDNKHDNHSNKNFAFEGNELRKFIAAQKNMVVVCGDRHWQYMSIDPKTSVREYSCGPVSDKHAGGWKQDDFRKAYHRYLNVIGGFLSATVERRGGVPTLTFRFHDAKGKVRFEDRVTRNG